MLELNYLLISDWLKPLVGIIMAVVLITVFAYVIKIRLCDKKNYNNILNKLQNLPPKEQSTRGALPKGYQQQNPSFVYDGNLLESDLNDNFRRLSWENAEDLVGTLFSKKGYSTTVTQRSGDFGIDVEARTDREFIGIQVKHWNGYVDFDTVAKTLGVQNKYNRVIIVSTKAGFSSHALTWANRDENRYRIELWDTNRFKNELRQYVLKQ